MNYITHFECAACLFLLLIWLLFLTRRTADTRSSVYFSIFCILAFSTALFDVFRAQAINDFNPSISLHYFLNAVYMTTYVCSGLTFMCYADSIAKIGAIQKPIKIVTLIAFIYQIILSATTYYTHLYFYFDDNMNYHWGPLYYGHFIIGLGTIVASIVILDKGRAHFSKYQSRIIKLYFVLIIAANIYQYFNPDVLIGGLSLSILALFLYVTFENPAYFFFKETHCQNREAFYRTMKMHIRNHQSFSLVIGMINDYPTIMKSLNSTQKENLFKSVADRLSARFSKNAFLLDGDHFAVKIMGSSDSLDREHDLVAQLQQIFDSRINLTGRTLHISIKTAIIPSDYAFDSADELNGIIGYLLELSSNQNMTDTEKFETALNKKRRHDEVEKCVEKALENDGFMVYYQPIFNVDTGKFESAEALVRLIDDELGFVSPEEFIPITEECGQIIPLGEQVFKKVCQFINTLKEEQLGVKYIEVNMSPVQCEKHDIADTMFSIMESCNTDPSMINFEITETAEAEFSEGSLIVENIMDMNKRGVNFSIDDFGSGFSAMDHLFSVPVELVKVDKAILWQAISNEEAMIVLQSTLKMIHALGKKILVEGVENQEMVDILTKSGCNYMQGYFFSKPIPENEYLEFLRAKNK